VNKERDLCLLSIPADSHKLPKAAIFRGALKSAPAERTFVHGGTASGVFDKKRNALRFDEYE
jgi:hypothetical protein